MRSAEPREQLLRPEPPTEQRGRHGLTNGTAESLIKDLPDTADGPLTANTQDVVRMIYL